MLIEVLISTMNCKNVEDLKLNDRNIYGKVLIINQINKCFYNGKNIKNHDIRLINYIGKGLSESRNKALENAIGDICIIADDDIYYKKDTFQIIKDSFNKYPEADILTFQIETPNRLLYKNYPPKFFWHNKRSILRVSSIEIAFKRNKVIEKGIRFDELFGINSIFPTGEENIFLSDCLKKGLKVGYVPIPIVIHPAPNSFICSDELYSKGAIFFRIFGFWAIFLNLLFVIKKYNLTKTGFFNSLKIIYSGTINYIRKTFKK